MLICAVYAHKGPTMEIIKLFYIFYYSIQNDIPYPVKDIQFTNKEVFYVHDQNDI